jgi:YVTN family beta-propeller protein
MTALAASGKTQAALSVVSKILATQAYACHGESMDVHTRVEIGTDFLGYRIEELIGRGGMGVVYRAYDLRLKRPVALKLVAPSLALDERFRERFARETELVMSLEHPNVVPIYDAGDVDGRVYLAMRLVDGSDLGSVLRTEEALEPARALAICSQVGLALDAAHASGLVHRDVKPSNVLLDRSEHVYLADFGLTRRLDEQLGDPADDRSLGTPAYLAPEQLDGQSVDGRADVYSLGCLLYESLTGERVFPRGSRLAEAWAHLEEDPPRASRRRPDLPDAVDEVICRALAKEPGQRYPTCAALISAAQDALGLRRPAPNRRITLFLAVGVLAAALAAVAVVLATDSHAKAGASAPLFARDDSVARINPATNKVTAVIGVGASPTIAAAAGHYVWVYNQGDSTISEIDATTNRVRRTTTVPGAAVGVSWFAGPVLAADAMDAWFIDGGLGGQRPLLTRISVDGSRRTYRLDITPTGVATGDRAVWVVGRGVDDYQVLRFNPADGRVDARTRFPASTPVGSIAFGYGDVWVVDSAHATLYRIDPRTVRRAGRLVLGTGRAGRPEILPRGGDIWIRQANRLGSGGSATSVDPSTLSTNWVQEGEVFQPDWGEDRGDLGALWWYTWQTGSLFRQELDNGPIRTVHVTRTQPDANGPCLTSIAIGSRSLWLTAAPPLDGGNSCPAG